MRDERAPDASDEYCSDYASHLASPRGALSKEERPRSTLSLGAEFEFRDQCGLCGLACIDILCRWLRHVVAALICCGLAACATSVARNAVPLSLTERVEVKGVRQVRNWGDVPIPNVSQMSALRLAQIRATRPHVQPRCYVPLRCRVSGIGGRMLSA